MLKKTTTLVATMLLLALPLLSAPASADVEKHVEHEQITAQGCLTQAADEDANPIEGVWVLTRTDDGSRILLRGDDPLEKYDDNQEVRITGVWEVDRGPELTEEIDDYVVVTEVQQVADHCDAPTNPDEGTGQRK